MTTLGKVLSILGLVGVLAGPFEQRAQAASELMTPTGVGCIESGECFILLASPLTTSSTCASDKTQVRWLSTQPGSEYLYKTALAAFLSGKRLIIAPNGTQCVGPYMRPYFIHITN